jgi:UDP-glucose:(glucosyl)LPS alpha-1,2-glucosyltransferase
MNESWRNEANENAMSGSEMMMTELEQHMEPGFLDDFQIILSRPRELLEDKIRIFYAHDLPDDPESVKALSNSGWSKFHKFVFVSNWQAQRYIERYNIPWSRTVVLRNAINDIEVDIPKKFDFSKNEEIRMIYHTTPHRGLNLLIPVFEKLCEHVENVHLDVYSSFKLYGWEDRDSQFEPLYDRIEAHDNMTYHGSVDNETIRTALSKSHVFPYPCTWQETSCRSLIEAMASGLMCIHPNYAALYETAGYWTFMYPYHEVAQDHAAHHFEMLHHACSMLRDPEATENIVMKLQGQASHAAVNYSWEVRKEEWKVFLNSCRNLPREFEGTTGEMFSYKVSG